MDKQESVFFVIDSLSLKSAGRIRKEINVNAAREDIVKDMTHMESKHIFLLVILSFQKTTENKSMSEVADMVFLELKTLLPKDNRNMNSFVRILNLISSRIHIHLQNDKPELLN